MLPGRLLLVFILAVAAHLGAAAAEPTVQPVQADGIWPAGVPAEWTVTAGGTAGSGAYDVRRDGDVILAQGPVIFGPAEVTIGASAAQPGSLELEVFAPSATAPVLGGALVDPAGIAPASDPPADFSAFWQGQLQALAAIPADPELTPMPSGVAGVDYWQLTLANIGGAHVQGQLARPAGTGRLPALLVLQHAGVYALQTTTVTDWARKGWLACNIMALDLPIDGTAAYYANLAATTLSDYQAIGYHDRTTSVFLPMILGACRAADYLASRPDWNGQVLAVTGTSQGGLLALATAGLDAHVTAVFALVPAGCDTAGISSARAESWPFWSTFGTGADRSAALATARYFDGANFAAAITCPALVGVGLIDTTARPTSVLAAYNVIAGRKELVVMPESDHLGTDDTQQAYVARLGAWTTALQAGGAVPPTTPGAAPGTTGSTIPTATTGATVTTAATGSTIPTTTTQPAASTATGGAGQGCGSGGALGLLLVAMVAVARRRR